MKRRRSIPSAPAPQPPPPRDPDEAARLTRDQLTRHIPRRVYASPTPGVTAYAVLGTTHQVVKPGWKV